MSLQAILVSICVIAAIFFIGRRFFRALRRGGCSCDCGDNCKTRECTGGGSCPGQKNYQELKPK